jgi:hypothetical protein
MKKPAAQTYQDIDLDFLRSKLKLKSIQEKAKLLQKHPHVSKAITTGALAGSLLLGSPTITNMPRETVFNEVINVKSESASEILVKSLKSNLPSKVRPLTESEEKKIEQIFKDIIAVPAKANLEGEHLNTTYGLIGAEQHLRRYPGDVNSNHGTGTILKEGMAPGLGAWGYFAPSKEKLTPDLVEKEKWYAVVQTLYLPDWNKRLAYLRDWYKYRKVLIVNTKNGNAVIADVADAGPAKWTGKSFGGSPEVMESLGGPRYKAGPVILFFVDDPHNKIPLGPVDYNNIGNIGPYLVK